MTADRMLRWMAVPVMAALLLVGCGKKPEPAFTTWAKEPEPYAPSASSGNAFDTYVIAGQQVESTAAKYLDRVSFYPGQQAAATNLIAGQFKDVVNATSKPCDFKFAASKPFEKPRDHQGWRLIGRVFAWKAADASKAGNYDEAIHIAVIGTRFGFDLTGGGAMDASLGLAIVDDIRHQLIPYLDKMSPEQLLKLSDGMREALSRQAPVATTMKNESGNILLGVQQVQDDFSANKLDDLQEELGTTVKESVEYLKGLQDKKLDERQNYFNGFAEEAEANVTAFTAAAALPTMKRSRPLEVKLKQERPWRRFAPHFFGTLQPLLDIHDATTARTRLLVVTSSLMSQKEKKQLPSLSSFPAELATDPYSGKPFIFRTDGPEFVIYSIGPNGKDDGGDTDSTFTNPDLTLEQGS